MTSKDGEKKKKRMNISKPYTATVMGSSGEQQQNLLVPPRLTPDTDRLQWRGLLREWTQNVQDAANGGDTRAKGLAASLALTVYRSLGTDAKELVKESIQCGELVLRPSADENSDEKQTELVENIISIVAKDSPVDRIRRIVNLNARVCACVRDPEEDLKSFTTRFQTAAMEYLNIINVGQSSPESQTFAMVLLMNAKLSQDTFSSLLGSLLSTASSISAQSIATVRLRTSKAVAIMNYLEGSGPNEGPTAEVLTACKSLRAAIEQEQVKAMEFDKAYISLIAALEGLRTISLNLKHINEEVKKPETPVGNVLLAKPLEDDEPPTVNHEYRPNIDFKRGRFRSRSGPWRPTGQRRAGDWRNHQSGVFKRGRSENRFNYERGEDWASKRQRPYEVENTHDNARRSDDAFFR